MIDLTATLFEPDSATNKLMFNTGTATSPFTGGRQTTNLPGARWSLKYTYKDLSMELSRKLSGIQAVLAGGAEIAHIRDYTFFPRMSAPLGAPIVNGASQVGSSLKTSGWKAGQVVLEFGDRLSYLATDGLYHLHTVTANISSDENGIAYVPISPPLHNPPVDGAHVETINPIVSVTCTDSGEVSIDGVVSGITLQFEEALYIMS